MARFEHLKDYYASLPDVQRVHIQNMVAHVAGQFPKLDLVVAWNQPMFKLGSKYILGFMSTKNHTNLLTVSDTVISEMSAELSGYRHGKRSISLPFDWVVDEQVFARVVALRLAEIGLTLE